MNAIAGPSATPDPGYGGCGRDLSSSSPVPLGVLLPMDLQPCRRPPAAPRVAPVCWLLAGAAALTANKSCLTAPPCPLLASHHASPHLGLISNPPRGNPHNPKGHTMN